LLVCSSAPQSSYVALAGVSRLSEIRELRNAPAHSHCRHAEAAAETGTLNPVAAASLVEQSISQQVDQIIGVFFKRSGATASAVTVKYNPK
jgi:hypothetical protein